MTKVFFAICALVSLCMMIYFMHNGKDNEVNVFFIATLICGSTGAIITKIEHHSK
jgi:formate hydrogenlyase subunit 3/multisubunit Na+/H+ antiporter MnhD subunit